MSIVTLGTNLIKSQSKCNNSMQAITKCVGHFSSLNVLTDMRVMSYNVTYWRQITSPIADKIAQGGVEYDSTFFHSDKIILKWIVNWDSHWNPFPNLLPDVPLAVVQASVLAGPQCVNLCVLHCLWLFVGMSSTGYVSHIFIFIYITKCLLFVDVFNNVYA